ncbi:MAG: hypothetical protein KAR08_00540 [Candidatus Heimdallarchaeota archaeon]|nr:hypothetical protein [Candidatus Heimdallarchaeota archaeon]
MARKRGKKALYEVMSKARNKPGYGRTLKKMQPKKPVEQKGEPVTNQKSAADVETSKAAAKWWRKPRIVQFNVGRIEFSMPYQLAVALVLGFVLLVLAAFRLGQVYCLTDRKATDPAEKMPQINRTTPMERDAADIRKPPAPVEDSTLLDEVKPTQPKSTGNNVIVVQQWGARPDLVPVRAHFTEYGIDTEIVMKNGRHFLLTKDRYDNNPRTSGTDGYKALQEIIKVGAEYKAPPNYEPFTQHLFSDAYGKLVK